MGKLLLPSARYYTQSQGLAPELKHSKPMNPLGLASEEYALPRNHVSVDLEMIWELQICK